MMGVPRRPSSLLLLTLVILVTLLAWNTILTGSSRGYLQWSTSDFHARRGAGPLASRENSRFGNGYLIFMADKGDWTNFEAIVQSLQKHIASKNETDSQIYAAHFKGLDASLAASLEMLKMVKGLEIDALLDPMPAGKLPTLPEKVAWAIPSILEYLLVQHPTVIYVDLGYFVEESTLPEVLRRVYRYGEAVLPGAEYTGKASQLNPVTNKSTLPLLAYSREGFVKRIKPHLDCRRGIYCKSGREIVDKPFPGSVLKKGMIALRRVDPRIRPKMELLSVWNTDPAYETLYRFIQPSHEAMVNVSRKIKVGVGIDIAAGETFEAFLKDRLGVLMSSIKGQQHQHMIVLIYITNYTALDNLKVTESLNALSGGASVFLKLGTSTSGKANAFVKDTAALEAFRDGCQNYFKFGQSAAIPSATSGWLQSIAKYGVLKQSPLVIMTGIADDENIWMLRELVGSIHGAMAMHPMQPPPMILIVGTRLSSGFVEMIKLWQYVEYHDLDSLLLGSTINSSLSLDDGKVRLAAMEVIIRRLGHAVWVSPHMAIPETNVLERIRSEIVRDGYVLARMSIEGRDEYVVEGFDEAALDRIHGRHLQCIKGITCEGIGKDEGQLTNYSQVGRIIDGEEELKLQKLLPKPTEDKRSQNYCHLSIRPEVMYNPVAFPQAKMTSWAHGEQDALNLKESQKIKIAFLIPSKNKATEAPDQIHLLTAFLRSLLTSITAEEWVKFQYSLYIGYDRDDPVLHKRRAELNAVIDSMLGERQSSVLVKFHQLPTAKCITLLWNILFIDAMQDGNDYFYQINDDVTFESAGWSTVFVKTLRAREDFGVVGPNDRMWDCRLLTQSFVSRKHYEIFHWYYPTEIKDWYSDNWITQVYGGDDTHCPKNMFIRNGAASTRYNVCSVPKWREAIIEGQHRILEWRGRQNRKLMAQLKPEDPKVVKQ